MSNESWQITYPEQTIKYIEAFRRKYWDHAGVCDMVAQAAQTHFGTTQVSLAELGCGAGTNLEHLHDHGFACFGYDRSEESIAICKRNAVESQRDIRYEQMNFDERLPARQFDVVVSLFVPISLSNMAELMDKASEVVKDGGLFICMLLACEEDYLGIPEKSVSNAEFMNIDGVDVLRNNIFTKKENLIEFQGAYFANEASGLRMFTDFDKYDLVTPSNDLPSNTKFIKLARATVHGKPDQCPPMTIEVLDTYKKL